MAKLNMRSGLVLLLVVGLLALSSVVVVKKYLMQRKPGPLRILHMGFHTGCIKDFDEVAQELGLEVGTYSHTMSNAHIYSDQYEAAKELVKRDNPDQKEIHLVLPEHSLARAEKGDVTLIKEIVSNLKGQYVPLESIKGIRPH